MSKVEDNALSTPTEGLSVKDQVLETGASVAQVR